MQLHLREGCPLGGFGVGVEPSGVFSRQESHRNLRKEPDGQQRDQQRHDHRRPPILQHLFQCKLVQMQHSVEETLHGHEQASVMFGRRRFQKAAAEHGGQGQGNEAGDQNRHADGYGEFVQQTPHNPLHEQDRDEDRNQRYGHGKDGETYFPGTLESGLHGALPLFHVPDDILQHDNGVIHDKADRQGQGHHGDVVE